MRRPQYGIIGHKQSVGKQTHSSMTTLEDAFTTRAYDYLLAGDNEVAIIAINKYTKVASIKSSLEDKRIFLEALRKEVEGEEVVASPWLSEEDKLSFPESPGRLQDILANKRRTETFASQILKFWKAVRGQKMGCGEFLAWDTFKVDMGSLPLLLEQVERVREQLGGFSFSMADIIEWKDLKGMHGLATGNSKAVKVKWMWLEVLKFICVWSYMVVGRGLQDGVSKTPIEENVAKKTKKESSKKEKVKSSNSAKEEGRKKGMKRAMAAKADNLELAMALSVSEEIERERNAREEEDNYDKAVEESLEERNEVVMEDAEAMVEETEEMVEETEEMVEETEEVVEETEEVVEETEEVVKETEEVVEETEEVVESQDNSSIVIPMSPQHINSPVYKRRRRGVQREVQREVQLGVQRIDYRVEEVHVDATMVGLVTQDFGIIKTPKVMFPTVQHRLHYTTLH